MDKIVSQRIVFLGFLMTCLIVLYHSGSADSSLAISSIDEKLNGCIVRVVDECAVIAMNWFFTITGFLLFRDLSLSNYGAKIKRRILTLLVPYLLWQIIIASKLQLQGANWTIWELFTKMFLLQMWPPDGALWYVYAVFLLAVLSPLLLILIYNKQVGFASISVLVFAVFLLQKIDNSHVQVVLSYGYLPNIIHYLPSYIIGCYYGRFFSKSIGQNSVSYLIPILMLSLFADRFIDGILHEIVEAMIPILLLHFLPLSTELYNREIYHLSFLVYAIHQPMIADLQSSAQNVVAAIIPSLTAVTIFTKALLLVVALISGYVIHKFLKTLWPKALSLLTGNRC